MQTRTRYVVIALVWLASAPAVAYAQASITGVVRDTSGAVLPGVTVEAASPALIEKVRSVVTDGAGQYRIVDLRPGVYAVTFTLPGFSIVRREGIELAGAFTAAVDVELRVGALEEAITVTGETPIVDVQSAHQQQIVSRDVIAALPTGRAFLSLVTLNPSVVMSVQDVGGTTGPASARYTTHGSIASDSRIMVDGLGVASASAGGASGTYYVPNVTASQEVVTTSSGGLGLGEADTSGVVVNLIPRDGGNAISGTLYGSGATSGMQSNNYTQALKDRGLRAPNRLARNWDVTPAVGGPVVRDKLWYFGYGRHLVADNYVAGMFFNKNAGDPNSWTYEPDLSRQAILDGTWKSLAARLTWQASARHKFSIFWDEQRRCGGCPGAGPTTSPEASSYNYSFTDRVSQATWTSPHTNRLLLEAGVGTHVLSWGTGLINPKGPEIYYRLTPVTEQAGAIPGLTYRGVSGLNRQRNATYNWRSSASYVSGAHNAKVGYRGSLYNFGQHPYTLNGGLSYQFNNGVPNRLTQTVEDFSWQAYLLSQGGYAQDQWTIRKLTLQGGVRYDFFRSSFPAQQLGPTPFVPVPIIFPASTGASFHDVSPRMAAAYDLFGDGKTAVNVHLGKYMIGQESSAVGAFGSFMNPINRLATSTTRSWNDVNRNFVPDCNLTNSAANGECGAMANQNFAKEVFSVTFDPNVTRGWGVRPYSWEFGASVQRELVPRVSATVAYFHRWYGNFSVTDNLATTAADYTLFNLPVPVDPRLPTSGGVVTGVATINPDKFGQVRNQVTAAGNFGTQIERWDGVDITLNVRLPNGLVAQGGVTTGRTLTDNCEVAAKLPEVLGTMPLDFCRQEQPFQTQLKGLGSYTIPRVKVQVSGTWQNVAGPAILATYNAPNAVVAPVLGRNLAGGVANQAVSLLNFIPSRAGTSNGPVSLSGERLNQFDLRVAKLLTFGRTRTLIGLDLFNALNSSVVQTQNPTFGPAWLTPTQILQARFAKVSVQFDF